MEQPVADAEFGVRQRTIPVPIDNLFTDTFTEAPQTKPFIKPATWSEWWLINTSQKQRKTLRKILSPKAIAFYFAIFWLFYLLTDFEIVQNGEAYSSRSKCTHPLILFRDSSIRFHKPIPDFDIQNPDLTQLNDVLQTSTCYLWKYEKNMSCITPLAYGQDLRIISFRRKNGDILHLVNPRRPSRSEIPSRVAESNSLLPDVPAVIVERPRIITIEYTDLNFTTVKAGRFEFADAFCISSSLDLFDHIIPQIGDGPHPSHAPKKN
jgi:hypothetical protein